MTDQPLDPDLTIKQPEETDNSARPEDGDQHVSQEPGSAYDPSGEPVEA